MNKFNVQRKKYKNELLGLLNQWISPGIYIPGLGGVKDRRDVLITKDGCKRLTT